MLVAAYVVNFSVLKIGDCMFLLCQLSNQFFFRVTMVNFSKYFWQFLTLNSIFFQPVDVSLLKPVKLVNYIHMYILFSERMIFIVL